MLGHHHPGEHLGMEDLAAVPIWDQHLHHNLHHNLHFTSNYITANGKRRTRPSPGQVARPSEHFVGVRSGLFGAFCLNNFAAFFSPVHVVIFSAVIIFHAIPFYFPVFPPTFRFPPRPFFVSLSQPK